MVPRLLVLALLALALPVATAQAEQAPGRVAFSVAAKVPVTNVDAGGAGSAVALPDGGAVLLGGQYGKVELVRIDAAGRRDPTFGLGGVARPVLPKRLAGGQLLRRPDGRLLLVGTTRTLVDIPPPRLTVVGLTPDGELDRSFGRGGRTVIEVQGACGGCEPAALAADGSLLLTGATGSFAPPTPSGGPPTGDRRWVVARLTPQGQLDPSFGAAGVATVSQPQNASAGGFGVGVGPGGRILTLGRGADGAQLAAFTDTGAVDAGYHGGAPVSLPDANTFDATFRPDGGVDAVSAGRLVRITPAGERDATFGDAGVAPLPTILNGFTPLTLSTDDGGVVVVAVARYEAQPLGPPRLRLLRLGPDGRVQRTLAIASGFGGGYASSFRRPVLVNGGPAQDGFLPTRLLPRPGGGVLVVGGVSLIRGTGEGTGFSTGFFAASALTADLTPDPAFGGPATVPRVAVSVPAQRARSSAELRRVLVRIKAPGPGLVLVRVRDGRRRILAQSVEPVYAAGTSSARIPLTTLGRSALRRPLRVEVGHLFRDVLTGTAEGSRVARLR